MSLGWGPPLGAVAPGMGGEVVRAIWPVLQVESLSHCYWTSWPGALGQSGRGLAMTRRSERGGRLAGQLLCEPQCIVVNTTSPFPKATSLLLPSKPHSFKQPTDSLFARFALPIPSPYLKESYLFSGKCSLYRYCRLATPSAAWSASTTGCLLERLNLGPTPGLLSPNLQLNKAHRRCSGPIEFEKHRWALLHIRVSWEL